MIRCKCGLTFPNACHHAVHKCLEDETDEHTTVCSRCGKHLTSPISLDEAIIQIDDSKHFIAVICLDCVKEI